MTRILATGIALAILAFPARADGGVSLYDVARVSDPAPRNVRAPIPPRRPAGLPAFVRGRLVCAINVGRLLEAKGVEPPRSALAMSFLAWGRPSAIRPGAVQVERRRGGGHVRVVSHHDGNGWQCINPSARHQDWVLTPCANRNVIGWRVA